MNRPITIVACVLLTVILGFFKLWPEYQEIPPKNDVIKQNQVYFQTLQEHFSNLERDSIKLKKYEVEIDKIDAALPSKFSLPNLLKYLQETSSVNGLTFDFGSVGSGSSGKKEEKEKAKEFRFNLSLSGTYQALESFLATLEKSSRLIEVESIAFSSPMEEGKPFNFSVGIMVYSY